MTDLWVSVEVADALDVHHDLLSVGLLVAPVAEGLRQSRVAEVGKLRSGVGLEGGGAALHAEKGPKELNSKV